MDMFDRMLSHYPAKYLHEQDEDYSDDEKKLVRAGGFGSAFRVVARNCKVKVGTAERPNSCRGGDYNLVHCSEVGLGLRRSVRRRKTWREPPLPECYCAL